MPTVRYTKQLIEKLCKYISAGNTIDVACNLIGVHRSTFYRWKSGCEKGDDRYVGLLDQIEQQR